MARKIRTVGWIPFGDVVKYLFCVNCKKRADGCEPESLQLPEERLENTGKKLKMSLQCQVVEKKKPATVKRKRGRNGK
jgi:hypothetical protein